MSLEDEISGRGGVLWTAINKARNDYQPLTSYDDLDTTIAKAAVAALARLEGMAAPGETTDRAQTIINMVLSAYANYAIREPEKLRLEVAASLIAKAIRALATKATPGEGGTTDGA